MSAAIPQPSSCCSKCGNEIVSNVPGPIGPAGAAGTNGTNGINAFTTTTNSFIVPAVAFGDVVVQVANSEWMAIGQVVFVKDPNSLAQGYFIVDAIPNSTSVSLFNPGYPDTSVPGVTVGAGAAVVASGLQGPAITATVAINQGGTGQTTATAAMNALSPTTTKGDLIVDNGFNSPSASDVRLAVGSDGRTLHARSGQPTGLQWSAFDLAGTNSAITGAVPIANGGTGQTAKTAAFDALSPLTTAGDIIYRNGSNNVRLALGTAGQQLRVNAGATAPEWAANVNTVLQYQKTISATKLNITTHIPLDDTTPDSSTDGTSVIALTLTPTNNTSRLAVKVLLNLSMHGSLTDTVAAFLTVTGSTASVVTGANLVAEDCLTQIQLEYVFVPGVTSPITLTVFAGSDAAPSDVTINGVNNNRKYGGSLQSYIEAVEYA